MPPQFDSPPRAPGRVRLARSVTGVLLALTPLGAGCAGEAAVGPADGAERAPVPVEVAAVERGPVTARRTVSGSLEPVAEFSVAPKVGGRIARVHVELGDTVERGQVVAQLDDDEYAQAVLQAEADLAVARARNVEARSALDIATRALQRLEKLRKDGVTSESQLDDGRAAELASRAHVEVTEASVAHAEAALGAARIRLDYVTVRADWNGSDETRVVGQRFVDEGGNVSANTPLLAVVQIDPIQAVVYVAERDYRLLSVGQRAELTADAYPGETFAGRVARIAPVFRSSTRQARVELELPNSDGRLKPGMFVRATLELDHVDDAVTVPVDALTEREGQLGVLLLDGTGEHVHWRPVTLGLREAKRAQVLEDDLNGRVVTLGHELCDDGARVHVAGGTSEEPAAEERTAQPPTAAQESAEPVSQ